MNNENYNNQYNSKETSMIFWKDILKKLKERDIEIFRIIVSSGVSEEKDAKDIVKKTFTDKYSSSLGLDVIWRTIKTLSDCGLLDKIRIATGYRPFNILIVTEVGKQLYRKLFLKEPPMQEHQKLKKDHSSILHAYMIKDVKTILEKTGNFSKVTMGRSENRIPLYEGKAVIPDVIGYTNNFPSCFIEVECGNHNQEQFNEKCNKLAHLTRFIIIVGRSQDDVTNLLKPQVDRFIRFRGRESLKIAGIHIYLYSIADLSKGKITYHYDMSSDEPICCFGRKAKEV